MARLPGAEALGDRPTPTLPRRTPLVADYRATSGMEGVSSQALGHSAQEMQMSFGIAMQAQENHDIVRAEDAFNQLRKTQLEMSFGKDGFFNLKGGDAANRPLMKEYGGAFDTAASKLAGTLDNDYQRQLFTKRSQVAGMQLREDIVRHAARESEVYANTVFNSRVSGEIKAAGSRWRMPDAEAVPLANIDNAIEIQAQRLGLPKEWIDDSKAKARAGVYTSMVKAALASDPLKGPFAAEAILKLHGESIDPAARLILSHQVKSAIRPIEVGAIAEDSVKEVMAGLQVAMQAGGEGAVNQVVSDAEAPTTFRFRKPDGTIDEGTARSEKVGADYGALILGMRRGEAGALTNVDVNALVGEAIAKAEQKAAATHPGDVQFRDEAVQRTKNYIATIAAARESGQVAAVNGLLGVINPVEGKGPQTKDALLADPRARGLYLALTPRQQLGIDESLASNVARGLGASKQDKAEVLFDLARRTQLPVGDPARIRNASQIVEYLAPEKGLTQAGFNFVLSLAEKTNAIGGQSESKWVHYITQRGAQMMASSTQGQALLMGSATGRQSDVLDAAQTNFAFDVMRKVEAYNKEGKDVAPLFDPKSNDYLLNPAALAKYLPSPKAAVKDTANGYTGDWGDKPAAPQYEVGKTYTFKQGKFRYKGGDPGLPASFEAVK